MRITYDFYQRCTKLPPDQLAQATALKVYLFGSLSATGKGHGTERAALAGLVGKEPATVDPLFLDSMKEKPDQTFPVKLGDKTVNVTLKDVVFDAVKGDFPHPNTMTCKLMAGDKVLLEQEYYSVGGGFIEWKGYTPPKKNAPKYPFSTMMELRQHAERNGHDRRSGAERWAATAVRMPGFDRHVPRRPANARDDRRTTDAIAQWRGERVDDGIVAGDYPSDAALADVVARTAALGERALADLRGIGGVKALDELERERTVVREPPAARTLL
jgi:hypothetical protein